MIIQAVLALVQYPIRFKMKYKSGSAFGDLSDSIALLKKLRTQLPRVMREQLNLHTQSRAYFLLDILSDDASVQQLRERLQKQYQGPSPSTTPIEQALALVAQLQESSCNHMTPFKHRLPNFLGEYPIHSKEINRKINQFNAHIEAYYTPRHDGFAQILDSSSLEKAWQDILDAIKKHYMGCNIHSLWQLLKAMSSWSVSPIEKLLATFPYLLSPVVNTKQSSYEQLAPLPTQPVDNISQAISANKQTDIQPFTSTFDYTINEAGKIDPSIYLLINGFALKPGGHADALAKNIPDFLPWKQWQSNIRRQLSQFIALPLNDDFFDWLQIVLEQLGVEFMTLKTSFCESSYECYVSPFLTPKTILNTLNEDMVLGILQESCKQASITIEASYLPFISRYLIRFLQRFQYNRGQSLGIGANWGGVVSDSNEAGADAFRLNDAEWASHFRQLSTHRQGPAEAHMNAMIGVKYELEALLSSFEYMTQLQPSEYADTLYNALVDNLVTGLFPEPAYFENETYTRYRRHYVVNYADDGMQHIDSFYQQDPQGTYFKTKKGDYKQTPMFRQAGSLVVEPFPRDIGSGDCFQSLSVANPLWPLQLQYAQSSSTSMRGHIVYNPIGPDEFLPDAFYGQIIYESDDVFIPFIGVIPKNFDKNFNQVELCASFVVRMLQSSRLMTYCPAFSAYYFAIATRFLPPIDRATPVLPSHTNPAIKRKWQALDKALNDPGRSAAVCYHVFFSLFKELIYSLYSSTKHDTDLHYYFVELTTSPDAFEPKNRATCERLLRDLTTLKPLQDVKNSQYYDFILQYLRELTDFFYPHPCDQVAEKVAQQARMHVKTLLALPEIKGYFADLNQKYKAANISPKVSPGLMHDALKYQGPSPDVGRDFYSRRHATNFPSGYRDLDGSQMVRPSIRETLLDKAIKTGGAILALIHRNKTPFSLVTQPVSQVFIAGYQTYCTHEEYNILKTILSGMRGFMYGIGLGVTHTLSSIPTAVYTGWFHSLKPQQKASHVLAISSAPSNEPGLCVEAMMCLRDHLLQLMAANNHESSQDELITLLLAHVKKVHPSLLSKRETKEAQYKKILLETFPLEPSTWRGLFEPIISVGINNKRLQDIINQYALQIDSILIYALYECLTAPNGEKATKEVIQAVVDKYKLKYPQDKALTSLVDYYVSEPEIKRHDLAQYRFHGAALMKLKEKEQGLRKIQTWINNALDIQWGLEALLACNIDRFGNQLNRHTLAVIVSELPDSMKEVLHELLSKPGHEKRILDDYELDQASKEFLLKCSICYKTIASARAQDIILERLHMSARKDSSLSIKAREHLKLTQFIQREWHHQLLPMNLVQSIIDEIKKQMAPSYHPDVEILAKFYETGLENSNSATAFDAFYETAMKIQREYCIGSPLHEWVNVTMNGFVNLLLEKITWTNDENPLKQSQAILQWLNHLTTHRHGVRVLLAQVVGKSHSFDEAAWRCQHILHVLETLQPEQEYIRSTGMQKLLRLICQNKDVKITSTGQDKAKNVPIAALCRYSVTMQHALKRVKEKIPGEDFVRPILEFGQSHMQKHACSLSK